LPNNRASSSPYPSPLRTCSHAAPLDLEYCQEPMPPVHPSEDCACVNQLPKVAGVTYPEPASTVRSGLRTIICGRGIPASPSSPIEEPGAKQPPVAASVKTPANDA
jgi:hypothetical protein